MKALHHATAATRAARARAMTLIEIIIVLVLLAILMAFAMPRLLGVDMLGSDTTAKTTAAGAMDTLTRLHAKTAAETRWDRSAYTLDAIAVPAPINADPDLLHSLNTDIRFTSDPSTGPRQASVASRVTRPDADTATDAGRRAVTTRTHNVAGVAVASDPSTGGTCWMIHRRLDAPPGAPQETYYYFDLSDADLTQAECSGATAASLDPAAAAATAAGSTLYLGRTWATPFHVTSTAHLEEVTGEDLPEPTETTFNDTFAREGEVVGSYTESGQQWQGGAGTWQATGTRAVPGAAQNGSIWLDMPTANITTRADVAVQTAPGEGLNSVRVYATNRVFAMLYYNDGDDQLRYGFYRVSTEDGKAVGFKYGTVPGVTANPSLEQQVSLATTLEGNEATFTVGSGEEQATHTVTLTAAELGDVTNRAAISRHGGATQFALTSVAATAR